MAFKFYKQLDSSDCGPTCLRMIAEHYGRKFSVDYLRRISFITKEGVSLLTISKAAERIGFKTLKLELSYDYLVDSVPFPCILYWNNQHFVILRKVKESKTNKLKNKFYLVDPSLGFVTVDYTTLMKCWADPNTRRGVVLAMEPTEDFFKTGDEDETASQKKRGFSYLFKYFLRYKKFFLQLCAGLLAGSVLSLTFPFLTQSIVDYGIGQKQIDFIMLILLFQLMLFIGNTCIEFFRSHLLLHISTRINITIISDFLIKLMKLPLSFFESRKTGDLLQRVDDHKRIEEFLTQSVLNTFFSIINLIMLIAVIAIYSSKILLIFLAGSSLSLLWNMLFMHRIKTNDYKIFGYFARNRDDLYELITGIEEIKLNDFELHRRWKWETTQLGVFKTNASNLKLRQYQRIGSSFFIQLMNIIITYISAREVLYGNITLGIMLTIAYLIGQMISPIEQLTSFFNAAQRARISLERMNEVHLQLNEEDESKIIPDDTFLSSKDKTTSIQVNDSGNLLSVEVPEKRKGIYLHNVSFQYEGPGSPFVLRNIHLHIPFGKTTAIVGSSGSGKTTLLKLLLKFYEVSEGEVFINGYNLNTISAKWWRSKCGVVMQEGYIFSDTVRKNISTSDEFETEEKLQRAVKAANVQTFIHSLPLGLETKIGPAGLGLSTGQKQRILIARAIYKSPEVILFDEATSSLDTRNEREIVDNLKEELDGKTVVIIAHRLSTVMSADKIVVLEDGNIVEEGNHSQLVTLKGRYFNLVKNQLELGS